MQKSFLTILLIVGNFLLSNTASADYFYDATITPKQYKFIDLTIPANAGQDNGWWAENGSTPIKIYVNDDTHNSYADLSISGTQLGDNLYATNNAGIGIKYRLKITSSSTDPVDGSTTSPDYRVNLSGNISTDTLNTYIHVYYQLVRLTDNVPAGNITSAPIVTLNIHNPDGVGTPLFSGVVYNGISGSQPKMTACTINAPTEIKLPPLYGSNLVNGAQNVIDITPPLKLTNCPGAINGISYELKAVYGAHDASNGVMKTETGTGYANGVYVQLQNADGSGYGKFNTNIPLDYTGSGDYDIPNYKIGYYIDNSSTVTAGRVKSALEFDVSYN
ncbi:type 1 fimbrial protein [Salmonella enterica subsp. enterica serovar Nijmegen]|uniref:Type 1 fimbrial protein n=1 Tax=Salmonella enterica subsp. enterica serovar Crewe TaxID=2572727 RepID=A0A657HW51_SALET|nr:type 1 fimbrial protein [Salmonella enterica subsp. enterica serovar Nijmegen]EFP4562996.1 fimbrial protein [Salmonella enterica]MMC64210.1 type 1 fimbrial protein [Salmonella enterica subsp. enterica serovar Crewe]EDS4504153.1 fimbrial protein [Salmonella enterica subsp. enterica serovar Nijmegen]EDS4838077.1 fimbrial protein [Salmonella enterica subsp. enterica serovar Nijmegen]